jgi:hypothetical protein
MSEKLLRRDQQYPHLPGVAAAAGSGRRIIQMAAAPYWIQVRKRHQVRHEQAGLKSGNFRSGLASPIKRM